VKGAERGSAPAPVMKMAFPRLAPLSSVSSLQQPSLPAVLNLMPKARIAKCGAPGHFSNAHETGSLVRFDI
jgi:hypothetical protein